MISMGPLLINHIFWGLFFEMYFSVNLFTERAVNRTIGTFTIPTAAIIALESTFIIILGPIFALVWQHMNPKKRFLTDNAFSSSSVCFSIANMVGNISNYL